VRARLDNEMLLLLDLGLLVRASLLICKVEAINYFGENMSTPTIGQSNACINLVLHDLGGDHGGWWVDHIDFAQTRRDGSDYGDIQCTGTPCKSVPTTIIFALMP